MSGHASTSNILPCHMTYEMAYEICFENEQTPPKEWGLAVLQAPLGYIFSHSL